MRKYVIILLLLNSLFAGKIFSQVSEGGVPESFKRDIKSQAPVITMPGFDVNPLLTEDSINSLSPLKPFRFAKDIPVAITMQNSGEWMTLDGGERIWRAAISSPGAKSLNFIFGRYFLPEGAKVFIYNQGNSEMLGAFTENNNNDDYKLATALISGDYAVIEYNEPKDAMFSGELELTQVNHAYREFPGAKDGQFGLSGPCNVDINCPDGNAWQKEKHSVCRIIMGGTNMCSGALLNNTTQDGTPYFMTANHCTGKPYNEWVFYFNYESPTCQGTDGTTSQTVSGCQLKATSTHLDFCLVQMNTVPPLTYRPFYAGWNRTSVPALNATCIHHPMGDVKKISKENHPPIIATYTGANYDSDAHWKISHWEVATTEGGSSGSPLFDENHRIIGDLTGGEAACGNSVNDYYARFDQSWEKYPTQSEQLKHWLDPIGSGVTTLNGFDPCIVPVNCDTISNIAANDTLTIYTFSAQWGYWSGHNGYNITKFAEKFTNSVSKYIPGINLAVAKNYAASSSAYISVKVWSEASGLPDAVIASKDVLFSQLTVGYWNNVTFYSPVHVTGNYYIGFEISYSSPQDTFAVFQSKSRGAGGLNTAYVFYSSAWAQIPSLSSDFNSSFALEAISCSALSVEKQELFSASEFTVYPNPTTGHVTVDFSNGEQEVTSLFVRNLYGELIYQANREEISGREFEIDLSKVQNGIYFITVSSENKTKTRKLILLR